MGIERTYLDIIKATYDKSTANIILNSEKLKDQEQDKEVNSPLLFNIGFEVLGTAIKQEINE